MSTAPADSGAAPPRAGHSHAGHSHGDLAAAGRARTTKALWITLGLNGGYLVAELVGGIAFGSLALIADAAHMAADVVGLAIALVAQALIVRPASDRHTFGLRRAEALGAQANGVILLATSAWILVEAVHRLRSPEHVDGIGLLVIAFGGLIVNVAGVALLLRTRSRDLNVRGALLHLGGDALGSLGAIVAGIAVVAFGADRVDPAVSIFIALIVIWAAWGLLRDTTHVLLEGTPRGLDAGDVAAAIERWPGVESVHHLHVWELASDMPALSAHVVLNRASTLHDAQARGDDLKAMLHEQFGIDHATLELECHECEESTSGA